jgi:hypothetical protein
VNVQTNFGDDDDSNGIMLFGYFLILIGISLQQVKKEDLE